MEKEYRPLFSFFVFLSSFALERPQKRTGERERKEGEKEREMRKSLFMVRVHAEEAGE